MQACFLTPNLSVYLDGGLLEHADAADFIHAALLDAEITAARTDKPSRHHV